MLCKSSSTTATSFTSSQTTPTSIKSNKEQSFSPCSLHCVCLIYPYYDFHNTFTTFPSFPNTTCGLLLNSDLSLFSSRLGGRGGRGGGGPFCFKYHWPQRRPLLEYTRHRLIQKKVPLETPPPPLNVPWRRASKPLVTNFETKIFKFRSYSYTTPQKYMRFRW